MIGVFTQPTHTHLGNEDLSRSKYSPSAFCILANRSASLSKLFSTPGMFTMSITSGDLATFFMRVKNSELMLEAEMHREYALISRAEDETYP